MWGTCHVRKLQGWLRSCAESNFFSLVCGPSPCAARAVRSTPTHVCVLGCATCSRRNARRGTFIFFATFMARLSAPPPVLDVGMHMCRCGSMHMPIGACAKIHLSVLPVRPLGVASFIHLCSPSYLKPRVCSAGSRTAHSLAKRSQQPQVCGRASSSLAGGCCAETFSPQQRRTRMG